MAVNVFRIGLFSRDLEEWLWDNVGCGGEWLIDRYTNVPLPTEGDAWGTYWCHGCRYLEIVDKERAVLYQLTHHV